jgi:hypothetical protein
MLAAYQPEFAMSLMDILSPYANRPTSTEEDFDEVAKQVPPDALGDGIAHALRSDKTPPATWWVVFSVDRTHRCAQGS